MILSSLSGRSASLRTDLFRHFKMARRNPYITFGAKPLSIGITQRTPERAGAPSPADDFEISEVRLPRPRLAPDAF